jgi:hypothetical protein
VTHLRKQPPIWVNLERVEQKPGPYTMSFAFSLELMAESIRKIGLINPPKVAGDQEGKLQIVTGYRRIHALKSLGESKVLCEDVTSILPSPLERLLENFYENLSVRKFNDIEKAMILQRLQCYLSTEEILASFLPLLSLPCHESTLGLYLKLADLEEGYQGAIANQEISMRTVKALFECDDASRRVLFENLSILRFNFNQQIKFIDYVNDIAIRDGVSIPEVLSEESFAKILENRQWNNPQKAKAVLEILKIRRYPRLARAQHAIQRKISTLSLPSGAAIHYDPYLEAPNYRLEICFKNGKDLRKLIDQLHSLDELETIPDLWQP